MKNQNLRGLNTRIQERLTVDDAVTKVSELMQKAIVQVRDATGPGDKNRVFPNGIDLVYIRLEIGAGAAFKGAVELKLAGPTNQEASLTKG